MRRHHLLLLATLSLLPACENTMNGVGRDMQNAGASLSAHSDPTPPPPPPPPLANNPYQYQQQPYHDPGQPYDVRPQPPQSYDDDDDTRR